MRNRRVSWGFASGMVAILVSFSVLHGSAFAGGNVNAGGQVVAEPPGFGSFAGNRQEADNSGTSVAVFTGSIRSSNGEKALTGGTLSLLVSGPDEDAVEHRVVGGETNGGAEPEAFSRGWKVWSGTDGDGVVHFAVSYAFPIGLAPGTYTITPRWVPTEREDSDGDEDRGGNDDDEDERDAMPILGTPVTVRVSLFTSITLSGEPVDPSGRTLGQLNWGMWSARPGQRDVESSNYIRIVNAGQDPRQGIVVDFTGADFVGADGLAKIPVGGNLEFAVCTLEDATKVPADCPSWSFKPSTSDGSTSARFAGLGHVMFLKYRVKSIPDVVPAQTYSTAFTVDKL